MYMVIEARLCLTEIQLEQDQERLRKAAQDANSTALAKAGEIAIVRANHEKTTREYDRRVIYQQQQHAEEVAKQKSDLEALRKEKEMMETEKRFLEHDIVHRTDRIKAFKKPEGQGNATHAKDSAQESPAGTPSKRRNLPFRDGFDDDEVMFISPIKPKDRGKPGTPRGGTKRKRVPSVNSPGPPLSFEDLGGTSAAATPPKLVLQGSAIALSTSDSRTEILQFVRMLIDQRSEPGGLRTLEILTEYAFPSSAHVTLASLVYDNIAQVSMETSIEGSRNGFCQNMLSLWERCLTESYVSSVY